MSESKLMNNIVLELTEISEPEKDKDVRGKIFFCKYFLSKLEAIITRPGGLVVPDPYG